jgi:uncharacterized membrane protein YsdA (DUF1294 family)/cold shock CspA family protein
MDFSGPRQEGVLTAWDDVRAFGYIAPASGGERVFAHIRAWPREAARPKLGDVLTFELELAPDGRTRARAVRRPFEVTHRARSGLPAGAEGYFVLLGFVALYVVVGSYWPVSPLIGLLYVVASAATFGVYAFDKTAARAGGWRTRESTLHLLAAVGGWPGAIVAQRLLHHKNRKASFQAVFRATVVVNIAAFLLLSAPVTVVLSDPVRLLSPG